MIAAGTRSGLVETVHDGAVAVVRPDGELVAWHGDIDTPFYLRSAAKPFQAAVSQAEGARLELTGLALASASHDGDPVHVAMVESMLATGGLSSSYLQCPRDWPLGAAARASLHRAGHTLPRRIWHNCSGKHAAWLRASDAQGWPLGSYLDPTHPIQKKIVAFVSQLGEFAAGPVGVDGCGAPVLRTSARAMALLYARLGSLPELRQVFLAMHRYPALVSGVANGDAAIATALSAAAKRGAQGCLGVALEGGVGIAVKSWDGLDLIAEVGATAVLDSLGLLGPVAAASLEPFARPAVRGGGRVVGEIEPRLKIRFV